MSVRKWPNGQCPLFRISNPEADRPFSATSAHFAAYPKNRRSFRSWRFDGCEQVAAAEAALFDPSGRNADIPSLRSATCRSSRRLHGGPGPRGRCPCPLATHPLCLSAHIGKLECRPRSRPFSTRPQVQQPACGPFLALHAGCCHRLGARCMRAGHFRLLRPTGYLPQAARNAVVLYGPA